MKIKNIRLTNFKRFDDLTIDLGNNLYRLVVLVGPNGCGKSSVFDSFEQVGGRTKPGFIQDQSYLRKKQDMEWNVIIDTDAGNFTKANNAPKNFCYLRSAYRVEADFQVNSIQRKQEVLNDELRPKRMIDVDQRVADNYERLVGEAVEGVFSGEKDGNSVKELREQLVGRLQKSMTEVFPDLFLTDLGNPLSNGQFYFTKGSMKDFPYKNLSGGEKGAFDILLDLIVKTREFNNTIIAIDEPDLHMHSSLQRSLLREIYDIIPDDCQLWIATHSIGFIRGACELARTNSNMVALIDCAGRDFDSVQVLTPEILGPSRMRKIFETAVDDLAYMIIPSTIVICEGSLQKETSAEKKELDEKIYNRIFFDQDVLFIAGDCKATAQKAGSLLFDIVKKAGSLRKISTLVDKDNLTAEQIKKHQISKPQQKFLGRREIENYLFDDEILKKYCENKNIDFNKITNKPADIVNDDIKSIQGAIMNQCGFTGCIDNFKIELSFFVKPDTNIYSELKSCIGL